MVGDRIREARYADHFFEILEFRYTVQLGDEAPYGVVVHAGYRDNEGNLYGIRGSDAYVVSQALEQPHTQRFKL